MGRWRWPALGPLSRDKHDEVLAPWAKGLGYLRCGRVDHTRWEIKVGRVHRGQWNVSRMDRHYYGLIGRGRLWVLPAVIGAIQRGDRTLTLHPPWGLALLELRRRLRDGTGGKDLRIGKLRVEAHGAAMDNSCGSGKAVNI
eukprot:scaffold10089_cov110-Isochrysis_galbana.AAC.8